MEFLPREIRQEINSIQIGKKEVKVYLFADIEVLKEFTKKLLELINKFQQDFRTHDQYTKKQLYFYTVAINNPK